MRKLLEKIAPRYAWPYLIGCGATLLASFFLTKFLPHRPYIHVALPLDGLIPLRPGWILVYIGAYAQWIFCYIAVSRAGKANCRILCRADYLAKAVCALCFLLIPTRIERPEPVGGGALMWLVRFIYMADTPTNLFPSMHCLFSWLGTRELMRLKEVPWWVKAGNAAFSLMVFASTLLTRQHYLLDIPGGVLLAEAALLFSRRWEKRRSERK